MEDAALESATSVATEAVGMELSAEAKEAVAEVVRRSGGLFELLELFPERVGEDGSPRDLLRLLTRHRFDLRIIEHDAGPTEPLSAERVLDLATERRLVNLLCERGRRDARGG